MKNTYYVDVPNPEKMFTTKYVPDWISCGEYPTIKAARKYLLDQWGITKPQSGVFITRGTRVS